MLATVLSAGETKANKPSKSLVGAHNLCWTLYDTMKNVLFLLYIRIKSTWLNSQMTHTIQHKSSNLDFRPLQRPRICNAIIQKHPGRERPWEILSLYKILVFTKGFFHFSRSLTEKYLLKREKGDLIRHLLLSWEYIF